MKLNFRYSRVYDKLLAKSTQLMSEQTIDGMLSAAEGSWSKDGAKIISELSDVAQLPWKEEIIQCYLVSDYKYAFSDPLTIPISKYSPDKSGFVDIVSHELIHRLLSANEDQLGNVKRFMKETFPNIKPNTEVHIILYGIQSQVWQNLLGAEQRKNLFLTVPDVESYIDAWNIANNLGYDRVVDEFRKKI